MSHLRTVKSPLWLLLSHVVVGLVLATGTLWPYDFTSVLPTDFRFNNWPLGLKIATALAAAACVIGDIWFLVLKPSLAAPPTKADSGSNA